MAAHEQGGRSVSAIVLHDINNFHVRYIITYLSRYYYISRLYLQGYDNSTKITKS